MRWKSKPYVSAAEKRRRSNKVVDTLKRKGPKLNPVHINERTIARSFWGKAWCSNLESYSDYANRLPRGRTYVRNGSVVDLQITSGVVSALVSGTDLYKIQITIDPVKRAAWTTLKTECAGQVGSLMDLLQGELSAQVMEVMTRRETGLFPKPTEIELDCSCPDWAEMCKHVAAALYAVGTRLDESPELLFLLRGADHHELISEATKSVVTNGSVSSNGAATLADEHLAEVFGIDIESSAALPAPKKTPRTTTRRKEKNSLKNKTLSPNKRRKQRLKEEKGLRAVDRNEELGKRGDKHTSPATALIRPDQFVKNA
jgi:uncharacterized Zn finger protein